VDRVVTPDPGVDFDLIISDIRMPAHSGLEILEAGPQLKGFPPMILITAFGSELTHARARRFGAVAVFDKPFDVNDLLVKVREVLSSK
jgi:CheY-like chemotaxis protein